MKDQISALVDGEISPENAEHIFTAISSGSELGHSWATYHLIGDAMRSSPMFKADFTARLMQKLEAEPTVLAPKLKKASRISSAWSVAASVAAVMFVGWMVMQQQVQNNSGLNGVEIAKADIDKNIDKSISSEYLLAHQSYVPSNSAYIQPAAYAESAK